MKRKKHKFKYLDPERKPEKIAPKIKKGVAKPEQELGLPKEVVTSKRDLAQSFVAIFVFALLLVLIYFIDQRYELVNVLKKFM